MRRTFPVLLPLVLAGVAGAAHPSAPRLPHARVETALGAIEIEVDTIHAPVTAGNFLHYVDARMYDGGRFHRTVTLVRSSGIGGKSRCRVESSPAWITSIFTLFDGWFASVTGLRHADGEISMARGGPDTATSDFFICIGNQPELDFGGKRNPDGQGFAAFGRVVKGMEVVRAIQRAPADGQRLTPPVTIVSIRRVP